MAASTIHRLGVAFLGLAISSGAARAEPLDLEAIGAAAGVEATASEQGVVRISWARTDVPVAVDGARLPPFAGLGSWAAFTPAPGGAMVMGDTVVFADEVSPAMDAALEHGLHVTALHNHFVFDDPPVYFMHIGGRGRPEDLAASVKSMWDAIKTVRAASPVPARRSPGEKVDASGAVGAEVVERALGRAPVVRDGVAKVVIGRDGTMDGVDVGGPMGLTTWIAFSGSDARAAASGDVIMTAAEVQPVLRALRRAGFHVVALHNHMIGGEPAFYFTHFWAKGAAADLAKGFRSVLDAQEAVSQRPHE